MFRYIIWTSHITALDTQTVGLDFLIVQKLQNYKKISQNWQQLYYH